MHVISEMGGIDEQFLRNAAYVDAGTPEIAVLGDGDTRATLCREAGRSHASRPRPDYEEIEITIRQNPLLSSDLLSSRPHWTVCPASACATSIEAADIGEDAADDSLLQSLH
jgi:hypothetical protein